MRLRPLWLRKSSVFLGNFSAVIWKSLVLNKVRPAIENAHSKVVFRLGENLKWIRAKKIDATGYVSLPQESNQTV